MNCRSVIARDRRSARRRGASMLLVMVAIGIAITLSIGFLASQSMATNVAANSRNYTRARFMAESGIEIVGGYVRNNPSWRTEKTNGTWISSQVYGGGTLTVSVVDGKDSDGDGVIETDGSLSDDPTDPATITSTATFNGVVYTARGLITSTAVSSQNVLMIVPNASSLSAADQARKTLLESKSWVVTLLGESATQTELDDATADVLVVYVSSTVTSTTMATKLVALEIGVVSEPISLQDDLGMSSSAGTASSVSQITPINVSHYITTGMTANSAATITSSSQSMCYQSGTIATGAVILAQRPSGGTNAMLTVVDNGDTLSGGAAAAGRRVYLPWGGTTFDPSTMNTTAQNLLDRSLKWAAALDGAGSADTNMISVSDHVNLNDSSKIDSFTSSNGDYGGANILSAAVVSTNKTKDKDKIHVTKSAQLKGDAKCGVGGNANTVIKVDGGGVLSGSKGVLTANIAIPSAVAPTNLGKASGDVTFTSGTTVISADKHYNKMTAKKGSVVQISGNRTILCDNDVVFQETSELQILPNSSLVLYYKKKLTVQDTAQLNANTHDPSKLKLYACSTGDATTIKTSGKVYGVLVIPYTNFVMYNSAHFYGTVLGKNIDLNDSAILSLDTPTNIVIPVQAGTSYVDSFSFSP